MKIPDKIHFAGFDYVIEEVEKLDGQENVGRLMMTDGKIFIEKDMSEERKLETLIHECLHIAYRHTAFKQLSDDQEENIIKPWTMNLYGILKDNDLLK